jgi:hypothetical protein
MTVELQSLCNGDLAKRVDPHAPIGELAESIERGLERTFLGFRKKDIGLDPGPPTGIGYTGCKLASFRAASEPGQNGRHDPDCTLLLRAGHLVVSAAEARVGTVALGSLVGPHGQGRRQREALQSSRKPLKERLRLLEALCSPESEDEFARDRRAGMDVLDRRSDR